jgi:hypothetical protein
VPLADIGRLKLNELKATKKQMIDDFICGGYSFQSSRRQN